MPHILQLQQLESTALLLVFTRRLKHGDVQAKDEDGNCRLSGGDAFTAFLQGAEHVPVMVCPEAWFADLLSCWDRALSTCLSQCAPTDYV